MQHKQHKSGDLKIFVTEEKQSLKLSYDLHMGTIAYT